jgi:hypothetical protein
MRRRPFVWFKSAASDASVQSGEVVCAVTRYSKHFNNQHAFIVLSEATLFKLKGLAIHRTVNPSGTTQGKTIGLIPTADT